MVMRRKAFEPTEIFSATSGVAFKKFEDKINYKNATTFNRPVFSALKESILIDDEPELNALKPVEETIIAVADKMLKVYAYTPIIISNNLSLEKWKQYYNNFYSRHKSKKTNITIYTPDETIQYLKTEYKEDFKTAVEGINDPVLKLQLQYL